MKIRPKVFALLLGLFAVLSAGLFFVQETILLPSFAELERQAAMTDMERVAFAIRDELDQLEISARDWGNWANTYAFLQDHNSAYLDENLNADGMKGLKINALAFIGLDGKFIWAAGLALDSDEPLDIDLITRGALPEGHPWRTVLRSGRLQTGLLKTSQGTMLAALAPVLNGKGAGPHRGMVLFGRLLTAKELELIATRAQVRLSIAPVPNVASSHGSSAATTLVETESTTIVSRNFLDVAGMPVLTVRIDVPRTISARGRETATYATLFLVGVGFVLLLVLIAGLNRLVLDPISRMTRHVLAIGQSDDLTARLELKRTDEFGELAGQCDRMVARLADARRRLVDQSFDAGIAEMSSGMLHNIGNAMTPLSIRMALLQERLRTAPAADIEMVLAELDRGAGDPLRKAELEELLHLASRELARAIGSAQADVDAMTQQTTAIQKSLAEQMQFSRSGPVHETVRLPELVSQSAEILPDAVRQRLAIEIDDSLAAVGAVRIARTTLQQVFQNLILNAAESRRAAGPDRGRLRVSAAVEAEAEGRRLRIRFTDDGVGIAAQDLPRIFEKGFSTKSRDTHFGIGLHWCANAVNALGGTIRAASLGPGTGATIELLVPLQPARAAAPAQAA
jgi:sensor domain CHASE-containing protein